MEDTNIRNFLDQAQFIDPTFSRLELFPVLYSFFVCVLLAFLVRYFYIRFSTSVAGKMNIGNVLPLLASIVFLIILVVKSSIARSLGLVARRLASEAEPISPGTKSGDLVRWRYRLTWTL